LTLLFTGKISRGAARRDSGSRFCGGAVTAGRQKKIRFGRFNAHFELVWQQSNNAIVAGGGFVLSGIGGRRASGPPTLLLVAGSAGVLLAKLKVLPKMDKCPKWVKLSNRCFTAAAYPPARQS